MKKEVKDAMIASIEKVEAIEDFLSEWYSVNDLFETNANAANILLNLSQKSVVATDELKTLRNLIDQHNMLANQLKQFEKGGEA